MTARPRQVFPRVIAATLAVGVLAGIAAGCGSSSSSSSTAASSTTGSSTTASSTSAPALAPIHGTYSPTIDPSNFVKTINNRYFPLIPGTGFHYTGVAENGKAPRRDDMVVTHQTKQILGVTATVVRDVVSAHGKPIEKTDDWYAQDKAGNVWYMGEDSFELKNGKFAKAPDSWEGGVNGAKPGIIMPGSPQKGDQYRQEYYPNVALDQAKVLGSGGTVKVPQGSYKSTLLTVETAPKVDPGVAEQKYYVAGVGDIKEQTVRGNHEGIHLVSISHH